MRFREQLESQKSEIRMQVGRVSGGANLYINGEQEIRKPEIVLPYGMAYRIPKDKRACVLHQFCMGVLEVEDEELEAGEVKLFSKGGAEILLKNDGSVIINGQKFPKNE